MDLQNSILDESGPSGDPQAVLPTFGDNFLQLHAGSIISDPRYAIIELVANAWDAGADEVQVEWPTSVGERILVADNGTGMTRDEFLHRWYELNYNRLRDQGEIVEFPEGIRQRRRIAFGRNGVGRHAMFCFAEEYFVETAKAGVKIVAHVTRSYKNSPFRIDILSESPTSDHGTTISTTARRELIDDIGVIELIGSRFIADPEFRIHVNGKLIALTDLNHLSVVKTLSIQGVGDLTVRRYDALIAGRTSKQSGVAWWVNNRLVGSPSWDVWDGPILDARTGTAKRFVYVIEAEPLVEDVKKDWSGFYSSKPVNDAHRAVSDFIRDDLRGLLHDIRTERKLEALRANRDGLKKLPQVSQEQVARFVEEIQVQSPTLTVRDLENVVQVMTRLEEARSGYSLLQKLARMESGDIDALNDILDEWSVTDAKKVLDELHYRLKLIQNLESLVDSHTTDELHDLQPLFERGLWIFGPEFESISFTSNRSLAMVVRKYFGTAVLEHPRNRPDFVALPDASIGTYSSDSFNSSHEVDGIASVVIVELKRGGFDVTNDEKDQAMRYARELRRSGKVLPSTVITAYVLGSTVDQDARDAFREANTTIITRAYSTVLNQAHARTFHLLRLIQEIKSVRISDPELADVVMPPQLDFLEASEETF